jgi:hypothetical protein
VAASSFQSGTLCMCNDLCAEQQRSHSAQRLTILLQLVIGKWPFWYVVCSMCVFSVFVSVNKAQFFFILQ